MIQRAVLGQARKQLSVSLFEAGSKSPTRQSQRYGDGA